MIVSYGKQWASVLSRVALEQERMLPVLLDLLRTNNDLELRSLTGFLRNLSRHAKDKNDMGESRHASPPDTVLARIYNITADLVMWGGLGAGGDPESCFH